MIKNKEYVKLGQNCWIDKDTIIGYMPTRKISHLTLVIGDTDVIRSGTIVYLGSRLTRGFETGHNVIIREENVIKSNVKSLE